MLFTAILWQLSSKASAQVNKAWTHRWGPVLLSAVGFLLLMVDVMRHILLDHGGVFFSINSLAMYSDAGGLTFAGKVSQAAAIAGFVLVLLGVLWSLEIPQMVLARFR